jgi:hypothetical protein
MNRSWFAVVVVGLCALLSGCAMCAHPYDYTGPVIPNTPGEGMMGFCDRQGSILSGTTDGVTYEDGSYDGGVSDGAIQGEPTLAPVIQPQSVGYTSRRVTRQVVR